MLRIICGEDHEQDAINAVTNGTMSQGRRRVCEKDSEGVRNARREWDKYATWLKKHLTNNILNFLR